MEKMKRIKELLSDKGVLLVRTEETGGWFVHCWLLDGTVTRKKQGNVEVAFKGKSIFRSYVDDVEKALDNILKILGE